MSCHVLIEEVSLYTSFEKKSVHKGTERILYVCFVEWHVLWHHVYSVGHNSCLTILAHLGKFKFVPVVYTACQDVLSKASTSSMLLHL